MVDLDGQIGALIIVQSHVVEGVKRNSEFAIILSHFVEAKSVVA